MIPGDLVRVSTMSVYSAGEDLKGRVGLVLDVEHPDSLLEVEAQVHVMFDGLCVWLYESEITKVTCAEKENDRNLLHR